MTTQNVSPFNSDLLAGQIAVVTGAAQGNGRALAIGLARHGAAIALADLNAEGLAQTETMITEEGGRAFCHVLDVSDASACKAFAAKVDESLGSASIVVNNAGIIRRTLIDDPDFERDWTAILNVNINGTRHMIQAFLPQMRANQGRIINIGSILSFRAAKGCTAYAVSKSAIRQLTQSLAIELAEQGIRVNAIAPGVIATPMTQSTRDDQQAIDRFMAHTPMARVGQPEELVGPAVFLASELSSYVTGTTIPVDGGYLCL